MPYGSTLRSRLHGRQWGYWKTKQKQVLRFSCIDSAMLGWQCDLECVFVVPEPSLQLGLRINPQIHPHFIRTV
jgi:hypothetical protein